MERIIDKFLVQTDNGKIYVVSEFTEYVKSASFENLNRMIEGMKSLRTDDDLHDNIVQEGIYEIVELGIACIR